MRHPAIAFLLAVSSAALAQQQVGPNEPGYTVPGAAARRTEPPKLNEPARAFSGEVTAVDKASRTVTLRHGPISMLGVAAGTSEYTFKEAAALEHFKPGDRVRFNAVLQGRALVVTSIAPN